jgi:hypothetical protein
LRSAGLAVVARPAATKRSGGRDPTQLQCALASRRAALDVTAPLVEPLDEALRRCGDRSAGRKNRVDAGGAPLRERGASIVATDTVLFGDEIAQAIQRGMAWRLDGERVTDLLKSNARRRPLDLRRLEQRARMRDRLIDNRIDRIGHRNHS